MMDVAYHFGNLWFAGRAGNWPLARFYADETQSHLRWAVRVKPVRPLAAGGELHLGDLLGAIEKSTLKELHDSVNVGEKPRFEKAYTAMMASCYACHVAAEKPYLRLHYSPTSARSDDRLRPGTRSQPGKMKRFIKRLIVTRAPAANILIRLRGGGVFLSEGLQKWFFVEQRGAGRFEKIGLPAPGFLGHFGGTFEIMCGLLVLLGLWTRLAVLPLLSIMLVALATTKWPILLGEGFWSAAHAARTDLCMLLGSLFLLIV